MEKCLLTFQKKRRKKGKRKKLALDMDLHLMEILNQQGRPQMGIRLASLLKLETLCLVTLQGEEEGVP
jgi:hypothetical protein